MGEAPVTAPLRLGVIGTGHLATAITRDGSADGHTVTMLDPRSPSGWSQGPRPDVLVDCAAAAVTATAIDFSSTRGIPLVECVSDLTPWHLRRLTELAADCTVVRATNLSLGSYLQAMLSQHLGSAVAALERSGLAPAPPEAAVLERHPARKRHRPSATAVALAEGWQQDTGRTVSDVASLRAGGPVSDHELRLSWPEQTLVLRHEVHSLTAAATGALMLARWACTGAPGLYHAHQVYDLMLAATAGPMTSTRARRNGKDTS